MFATSSAKLRISGEEMLAVVVSVRGGKLLKLAIDSLGHAAQDPAIAVSRKKNVPV
jgi:hypothetical protein